MLKKKKMRFNPALVIFSLLLPLALTAANQTERDRAVAPVDLWCVAKNNAQDTELQSAIDWACGPGGADCQPIQQGGSCYEPEDIQSHASYAFNDYFVKNGGTESACNFSGTAALTSLNPGHGSCKFPSSTSLKSGNIQSTTYGSTVGLGPSGDLNSSPLLCLHYYILPFMGAVYVLLTTPL